MFVDSLNLLSTHKGTSDYRQHNINSYSCITVEYIGEHDERNVAVHEILKDILR